MSSDKLRHDLHGVQELRENYAVLFYKNHMGELITINFQASGLRLSHSADGDVEINIDGRCNHISDSKYPDLTHLVEEINKAANAMASSSHAFEESIVRMSRHLTPKDITWEDLLKGVD